MKALALLAGLFLLPAFVLADGAAPAGRDALLNEMASWSASQLPHVVPPNPLTTEFEGRLKPISDAATAARTDADLNAAKTQFQTWQHELMLKLYQQSRAQGLTHGTLDQFSAQQRAILTSFTRQNASVLKARLDQSVPAAGANSTQFFFGQSQSAALGPVLSGPSGRYAPGGSGPAAAPQPGLHINATPLPPPSSKPFSLSTLEDYFDRTGIPDAVLSSIEKIHNEVSGVGRLLNGFAGSCYYGVKWMLIKTHVLPPEVAAPEEIGAIGIGSGNAYQFNAALQNNPKLQAKLHVRALDLASLQDSDARKIPERTVLVFNRGCAGFSEESGHIEYTLLPQKIGRLSPAVFHRYGRGDLGTPTVGPNEVLACSDGCFVHTMSYLSTYGGPKGHRCLNAYVPVTDRPTSLPMLTADSEVPAGAFAARPAVGL
jgi:hypothetical protein